MRPVVATGGYGTFPLFLTACLAGCMAVVLACALAERLLDGHVGLLSYLGRHSMFYFASHFVTFSVLNQLMGALGVSLPASLLGDACYVLLTVVVSTPVCVLVGRFAPILEGKTND